MKVFRNVAIFTIVILTVLIIVVCSMYNYNISAVDKNDSTKIEVVIPQGTSIRGIGEILEEKGLIRSAKFFYTYNKLYKNNDMKATTYYLSKDMELKDIVKTLTEGNSYNPNEISITFNEGINMRKVATIISTHTNNSYESVFAVLKDEKYLDELIAKYWFLTDEIKNDKIYYSLEGYLYPETYRFSSKDISVKEIFSKMLDQTDKELSKYQSVINSNKYSAHELLTLASIVESESKSASDRMGVASVLYNRLNKKMSLGCDATSYYGVKLDLNERNITKQELDDINPYNTRPAAMAGKLPVGPICNVSASSIKAVLYPQETNYYYYVSDRYGAIHFTKNYTEHLAKIQELKDEGAWLEW